jgi:hypothetical protein
MNNKEFLVRIEETDLTMDIPFADKELAVKFAAGFCRSMREFRSGRGVAVDDVSQFLDSGVYRGVLFANKLIHYAARNKMTIGTPTASLLYVGNECKL